MSRTYAQALELLRSRIRPLHAGPRKNYPNNLLMRDWLAKLGFQDPNSLDVIHITGTKGKGTTAAYTAVFIEEHFRRLRRPIKVGLYTSPHLITERERIRINSQSVDEEIFTAAFFSLWEKLCENTHENQKPGYLQLLALLSFHMFKQANVDVAIYEVHAGGRKDATNIFDTPVACGITTIGLDHVDLLGKTIQDIASHKSGILKPNSPGFSLHQSPEAKSVLVLQADELPCPLTFIEANPLLDTINHMPLAQRQNISLAIELANAYLGRYNVALSTQDIHNGMELCKWPGRFHKVEQHDITWYLDCAHNTISMPVVLSWFALQSGGIKHDTKRILIFGHESNRDTGDLVEIIAEFCETNSCHFDTIILSPYSRYGQEIHTSTVIEQHLQHWKAIPHQPDLHQASSLQSALEMAKACEGGGAHVLVTGSTHLVGQALSLLNVSVDTITTNRENLP